MIGTSGRSVDLFILIKILIIQALTVNCQKDQWNNMNITSLESLRMQLFINYDTEDIPMRNSMEKTNISLGLSLNYIDINAFTGKLTLYGWIVMRWEDMDRTWKSESFNNITKLYLNPKDVWKPSVSLINKANFTDNHELGKSYVILYNNGTFLWAPKVTYTTYCNINLKYWPYDTQFCSLKIIAWSLIEIKANYLDSDHLHDDENLIESPKWKILNVKAEYHITEMQNYIEYTFQLKRRNSLYSALIFTPTSSIVLLTLLTFWLPPHMGEKILLNSILIVIVVIFLMFFGHEIPMMAANTPLIVLFYSSTLIMLSVSIMVAVIVVHLATSKHKHGIVKWLYRTLNGPLGRALLLTQFDFSGSMQSVIPSNVNEMLEECHNNTMNNEHNSSDVTTLTDVLQIKETSSKQSDWILLAVAIDRLCFLISSITFFILAVIYIF